MTMSFFERVERHTDTFDGCKTTDGTDERRLLGARVSSPRALRSSASLPRPRPPALTRLARPRAPRDARVRAPPRPAASARARVILRRILVDARADAVLAPAPLPLPPLFPPPLLLLVRDGQERRPHLARLPSADLRRLAPRRERPRDRARGGDGGGRRGGKRVGRSAVEASLRLPSLPPNRKEALASEFIEPRRGKVPFSAPRLRRLAAVPDFDAFPLPTMELMRSSAKGDLGGERAQEPGFEGGDPLCECVSEDGAVDAPTFMSCGRGGEGGEGTSAGCVGKRTGGVVKHPRGENRARSTRDERAFSAVAWRSRARRGGKRRGEGRRTETELAVLTSPYTSRRSTFAVTTLGRGRERGRRRAVAIGQPRPESVRFARPRGGGRGGAFSARARG